MKLIVIYTLIKFHSDQQRNRKRTMRKAQQIHAQSKFLPRLNQCSSRPNLKHSDYQSSKQNIQTVHKHAINQGILEYNHHNNQKKNANVCGRFFDDFVQIKLLDRNQQDLPTKPRMCKPWAVKQVDFNKITVKPTRLQSAVVKERCSKLLRRKSCQPQKSTQDSQKLLGNKQSRLRYLDNQSSHLPKTSTKRSISIVRDKIYSCKIAVKNGIFPIDKKKFEEARLAQYFERESMMSTIQKREENEGEDDFITFESYINMVI